MDENWCANKLASLQDVQLRQQTLNEIKNKLKDEQPPVDFPVLKRILTSAEIFDCITASNQSNHIDTICEILSICLSSVDLNNSNSTELLDSVLTYGDPRIRSLTLHEILRYLRRNPNVGRLEPKVTLLILSCLESEGTGIGAPAIDILSITLKEDYDNETIRNAFLKLLEKNDVIRCRMYEITVNLARSSPSLLAKVEDVLDKIILELNVDDIFMQLNILELLAPLAEQNHGLVYLENRKLFEKLGERVNQVDLSNPTDKFLLPGLMKFFGKTAYSQPQKIIEGYSNVIQCVFDTIIDDHVVDIPIALDTLGNLAYSSQGKILLERNYPDKIKATFEQLSSTLRNLPTDLKNRGFNALEIVLGSNANSPPEIDKITEKWCRYLTGSTNLQFFLEFCKNPFPDIKVSCLSVVKAICQHHWGVIALKNTAGFVEYLLDRRIEFDKDARFVKYELVTILAETSVFDPQTQMQLQKFVAEGVYFVEGIVEVAVDGT